MAIDLTRRQVTRQPNGDWHFGYTQKGDSNVDIVGSYDLSKEIVQRIWEQRVGAVPLTGLEEKDIVREWDRMERVISEEIEQRLRVGKK
jgi:hypothetical protein